MRAVTRPAQKRRMRTASVVRDAKGEYLNGLIMAEYLGFEFIDADRLIYFNEDGNFDAEFTNKEIEEVFSTVERAVIPGFYGIDHSGRIRTFSRGGSDITGSVIARGIKADLYENWIWITNSRRTSSGCAS